MGSVGSLVSGLFTTTPLIASGYRHLGVLCYLRQEPTLRVANVIAENDSYSSGYDRRQATSSWERVE